MDRDKKIKKEVNKLNKIFSNISEDKKSLCEKLIQNAAFIAVTLDELQYDINANGAVIQTTNGNGFDIVMENPAQKSYNVMINRYTSIIKQLSELLPDSKQDGINKAGEALASFIAKGK